MKPRRPYSPFKLAIEASKVLAILAYCMLLSGFGASWIKGFETNRSEIEKTAISTGARHCMHHPVACPPDCHCPPIKGDDIHVDSENSESPTLLSGDRVWRPCQSDISLFSGLELPVHLPCPSIAAAMVLSSRRFEIFSNQDWQNAESRPVEKVPIA